MPRAPRVFDPNGIYHVASRGSDRRPLYLYDDDREMFLRRLGSIVRRYELSCLAYCLMGNHYHLIVQTPDARLSAALRDLHGGYSRDFNTTHRRSAHLFRNRFSAQFVDSETHFLTACRYIAHNPVRAGLCGEPADWPWSSYRASAGLDPRPPFLSEVLLSRAVGGGTNWRRRYRDFVESPREVAPPLGDTKFRF
jgi:putative transposase